MRGDEGAWLAHLGNLPAERKHGGKAAAFGREPAVHGGADAAAVLQFQFESFRETLEGPEALFPAPLWKADHQGRRQGPPRELSAWRECREGSLDLRQFVGIAGFRRLAFGPQRLPDLIGDAFSRLGLEEETRRQVRAERRLARQEGAARLEAGALEDGIEDEAFHQATPCAFSPSRASWKRPAWKRSTFAKVSNQAATSSKPSSRATAAKWGYMSVYS